MGGTELLAVVEVEKERRIRCQATGCNHAVYKAIHVVQAAEGLQLLGSECCAKLFGWTSKQRAAAFTSGDRRLSAEEREQLILNTRTLLEKLKAEQAERHAQGALKLQTLRQVFSARQQGSVVGAGTARRPERKTLGTLLDPEVERQAKKIVSDRYQVDASLAGWRGLVIAEAKKIENNQD